MSEYAAETTPKRHPISAAWPDMTPEDFQSLRDSITDGGQREPVVLLDGEVLDGWQRLQACIAECIEPRFEVFSGGDPIAYVRDKHTRRPLGLTQRLVATALMNRWKPAHRPNNSAPSAELTSAQMARMAGASVRSAEQVKEAITHGVPEVVEAMKGGDLSAKRAAEIVKLPKDEQAEAITKPAPKPKAAKAKAKAKAEVPPPADDALRAEVAELRDKLAELASSLEETIADNDLMARVFDADDKVAAAIAEAKKLREMNRVLEERIRGLMNEKNEAIRAAKSWQRKAEGK